MQEQRVEEAKKIKDTLQFTGAPDLTHETFFAKLKGAYNTLDKYKHKYRDSEKVSDMLKNIVLPNHTTELTIYKEKVKDVHKNDFEGACSYLACRFNELFPPDKVASKKRTARKISSITIGNVELPEDLDVPPDKWAKLSQHQRNLVKEMRNATRSQNSGGRGRGRGGRGRGRGRGGYNNRYGGRGRGRGRGGYYNNNWNNNRNNNNNNNNNDERSVNETNSSGSGGNNNEGNNTQIKEESTNNGTFNGENKDRKGANNGNNYGRGLNRGGGRK